MNIKNLFKDDDAVSPVIGVILMVAITVILAAVIASFVLGLGDSADNVSPSASFDFDYDASTEGVDVTLTDGDAVEIQELFIRGQQIDTTNVDLTSDDWSALIGSTASDNPNIDWSEISGTGSLSGDDKVSSGQGIVVPLDTTGSPSEYQIQVVWESFDGDESATLASGEGPNA